MPGPAAGPLEVAEDSLRARRYRLAVHAGDAESRMRIALVDPAPGVCGVKLSVGAAGIALQPARELLLLLAPKPAPFAPLLQISAQPIDQPGHRPCAFPACHRRVPA